MLRPIMAFCFLIACSATHAATLYSNFQSPGDQHSLSGSALSGATGDEQANFFLADATGSILSIDAAVFLSQASGGNVITLNIYDNNSGIPGITSLGSVTLSGQAVGGSGSILTFTLPTAVSVSAGSLYWIALSGGSTTSFTWMDSLDPSLASEPYRQNGGAWIANLGTPGAFRVNGELSTVPLPAALWLLLSGAGGLGAMGRKRRTAAADAWGQT